MATITELSGRDLKQGFSGSECSRRYRIELSTAELKSTNSGREVDGRGDGTELYALNELSNNVPQFYNGILIDNISVKEISPGVYDGEVQYSPNNDSASDLRQKEENKTLEYGNWRVTISASTASTHISHGKEVIETRRGDGPAGTKYAVSNRTGAINVNLDDPDFPKADGIDIPTPTLSISLTIGHHIDELAYRWRGMAEKVAHMNDDELLGFERGELLYLGYQLSTSAEALRDKYRAVEITHEFDVSTNMPEIRIGGETMKLKEPKLGWDYLSVTTVPWMAEGFRAPWPEVVQADIIRVYDFANFDDFFPNSPFATPTKNWEPTHDRTRFTSGGANDARSSHW